MFKKFVSSKINQLVSIDFSILILRIGLSGLLLTHGYPKLMRILEGNFSFRDPIGLGPELSLFMITFAEFFCAALVLIGLWTRLASIPIIIGMIIIVFVVHADDPFSVQEKGLLFLVGYLVLLLTGSGKYSLDHWFGK